MRELEIQTITFQWQGMPVSVTYEPYWLGRDEDDKHDIAHIEVRSLSIHDNELPITETGYRLHFTSRNHIDSCGGPEVFVRAWLDDEAKSSNWKKHVDTSRQMTLF